MNRQKMIKGDLKRFDGNLGNGFLGGEEVEEGNLINRKKNGSGRAAPKLYGLLCSMLFCCGADLPYPYLGDPGQAEPLLRVQELETAQVRRHLQIP